MNYTLRDPNGNVLLAVESTPVVTEADMKADLDKAAKACESAFDEVTKYQDAMAVMSSEGFGEQVKAVASKAWEKIREAFKKLLAWFKKVINMFFKRKKKLVCTTKDIDKLNEPDEPSTAIEEEKKEPELRLRTNEEKLKFIYSNRNDVIQVYEKYRIIQGNGGIDYFKKCEDACDKYIETILTYIDKPGKIKEDEEVDKDAKRIGELVQFITMKGRTNYNRNYDSFGNLNRVNHIDMTDRNMYRIMELLKEFIENSDNIYDTFSAVANCIDSIHNKMVSSIFNGNVDKKLQLYWNEDGKKYSIINHMYYACCAIHQWSYGVSSELLNDIKKYNEVVTELNSLVDPNDEFGITHKRFNGVI